MFWNEGMSFYTSAEFCNLARQNLLAMASWPFLASGFLPRHPSEFQNRLNSPDRNFSPWRTLIFKNMVSRTHSRPLARPSLAMEKSRSLVRYGELWCEQDGDILEFIPAMATYAAIATRPLLLFFIFLLWFLSCSFFSCTIGSSKTQGV